MHLNSLEFPSPKGVLCQLSLFEIGPVVLEKKLLKIYSVSIFSSFRNYIPLEVVSLHLNNLEFPSPKGTLCEVLLKLA